MSPTRVRWLMRLAGLACVVAGLFPSTTRTGHVAAGDGTAFDVPVLGAVPLAEQHTTRTLTLGVPASPLYRHTTTTVVDVEEITLVAGQTRRSKDGKVTFTGPIQVAHANYSTDFHWDWTPATLSGLLVFAGLGLVIGAWFVGRRPGEPSLTI